MVRIHQNAPLMLTLVLLLLLSGPPKLATVRGNALTATNGQLSAASVRLRDVRYGRIVSRVMTDATGMFVFDGVEPGSYIVEIVASDGSVVAASQMLSVDVGSIVTAVVKMPIRTPPFGLMNRTGVVLAADGIAAIVATQPVSPVR